MKTAAIIVSAFLALCPATSWAQATGDAAFAQRNFSLAQQLWTQEAAGGSATAMLGLGLLADRGYNGQRDFDVAFDWYQMAADMGLAEAQFNIAVMYDAGLGRPHDAAKALTWYTRAALRGYPRAQYNLGLMYEAGEAVGKNADIAQYWFNLAASNIPAAAEKTVTSASGSTPSTPPNILFSQFTPSTVELIWAAPPTENPTYVIEMLHTPAFDTNYQPPKLTTQTDGSGLLLRDETVLKDSVWRVVNVSADASDYRATDWQGPSDNDGPRGRVTLVIDQAVPAMRPAVEIFAQDLRTAGYWVRVQAGDTAPGDSPIRVVHGYEADVGMAELVAQYLPGSADSKLVLRQDDSTDPSEITVYFNGRR